MVNTSLKYQMMIVAAFVAAAIIVCSCSKDETVADVHHQPAPAIIFHPLINHAMSTDPTRAVEIATSSNLAQKEFDMWAFGNQSNTTYVFGYNQQVGYRITTEGIESLIRGQGEQGNIVVDQATAAGITLWGYKTLVHWPTNCTSMQFYAISPAISSALSTAEYPYNAASTYAPNLEPAITSASPTFHYKADETFNGDLTGNLGSYSSSHSDMRDILVAGRRTVLSEITGVGRVTMNVNMTFRHALSQIAFEGKVAPDHPGLEITVHSITLCNLYRQGTCTIGTDGTPSWSFGTDDSADRDANRNSYTIMTGEPGTGITLSTTAGNAYTAVPLSSGTDPDNSDNLMLIPQALSYWQYFTNAQPESQSGSYLKIRMSASQQGVNLLNEDFVYVPFGGAPGVSWNGQMIAGRKYTFTLVFGLGRNSQGKSNGTDITYNVNVGDWTTDDVNIGL